MGRVINRENILATVSVLAFIMSASTWVAALIHNRRSIDIRIYEYKRTNDCHIFYVGINNKSRLAATIHQIDLNLEDLQYQCTPVPTQVREVVYQKGKDVTGAQRLYSLELPMVVQGLGARSGYVIFEHCPQVFPELPTPVNFVLYTTRGKPKKLSPLLDERAFRA